MAIGNGLSEFVSRRGRIRLVALILNRGWSVQQLAVDLGVTRQAIYIWLKRRETHPCNFNLDKLIDIALSADRLDTIEIIREEVTAFQSLFVEKFKTPQRFESNF